MVRSCSREQGQGLEYPKQYKQWIEEGDVLRAEKRYGELREVLLEVNMEAINDLTRASPKFILFCQDTDSRGRV